MCIVWVCLSKSVVLNFSLAGPPSGAKKVHTPKNPKFVTIINNDKWRRGQHNRISTLIFMQFSLHNFPLVIHAYRFKIKIILTYIECKIVFLCKIMWYVVMQISLLRYAPQLYLYMDERLLKFTKEMLLNIVGRPAQNTLALIMLLSQYVRWMDCLGIKKKKSRFHISIQCSYITGCIYNS